MRIKVIKPCQKLRQTGYFMRVCAVRHLAGFPERVFRPKRRNISIDTPDVIPSILSYCQHVRVVSTQTQLTIIGNSYRPPLERTPRRNRRTPRRNRRTPRRNSYHVKKNVSVFIGGWYQRPPHSGEGQLLSVGRNQTHKK